jgi:hypothetical protein
LDGGEKPNCYQKRFSKPDTTNWPRDGGLGSFALIAEWCMQNIATVLAVLPQT